MRHVVGTFLAVSLAWGSPAGAEPSEPETLFAEGRALIEAGKPYEACRKFEQSLAKDPRQIGVLMNLGLCSERAGKIATAVRYYREAFDRATEANLPTTRAKAAKDIARLVADVPVLVLEWAGTPLASEKVLIDDVVVAAGQRELTLDPGRHTIDVTASGRLPFQATVTVRSGERTSVTIPELERPVAATTIITAHAPSARRPVGKVMVVAGLAGVAVAGAIGLYARNDYHSLFEGDTPHCGRYPDVNGQATCDETGQSRASRDHTLANVALVGGGAALAVALVGAALWWTAPAESSVTPTATATSAGVVWTRSF